MKKLILAAAAASTLSLTACATTNDPYASNDQARRAATGAAIGAAGGAIVGAATAPVQGRCPPGGYLAADGYCYPY